MAQRFEPIGGCVLTPEFKPLFTNPDVLTVLGNYWPRKYDWGPFPVESRLIRTAPDVEVLVQTQRPLVSPRGELVLLHGLEGSGESGYMLSLSHRALHSGFAVHRFHMRTCGGTERLCNTLYHAGLTSDLLIFLQQEPHHEKLFLIGFSLGGNVALKAAGETGTSLLSGVVSVNTPIDLAACSRCIQTPRNRMYQDRFAGRMKDRLLRTGRYVKSDLQGCRTVWDIDDKITAPSFGFRNAAHYYETQSALRFVPHIEVPVLMIAAQDDPLVPFDSYHDPVLAANPRIQLVAPRHGGHLGFLSRKPPRFWSDEVIANWLERHI